MSGFPKRIFDFFLLVKAEIKRDFIFMKRYPLEPISFLFFMFMILIAILYGFKSLLAGNQEASSVLNQEIMILGYSLMQFIMSTQMGWSGQISNESQTGTLEQLSISGHTLGEVLLSRGFAQLPRQIISFFLLFGAYSYAIPEANILPGNFLPAIPILFLTALGTYGIAYFFAGLTLLFKRVGFFFQIINFGFLGLFWQNRANMADGSWMATFYDIFPLTVGMANLREVLIGSAQNANFVLTTGPWYLLGISLVSCILGYLFFYSMERRARKQALLSQY